jgi:predicted nucleic acid-binding protein
MLVADTSAIVPLYIQGENQKRALAAYLRDPDWASVPLWRYEFLNVVWKRRRAGFLGAAAAQDCFPRALERIAPLEQMPDGEHVLALALEENITAYDACYVSLAQQLHLPLLTEDGELLAKFPKFAVSLADFGK